MFVTNYETAAVGAAFTVELANGGGFNPNNPSVMANVAIQYTGPLAYPTPLIFYSAGAF